MQEPLPPKLIEDFKKAYKADYGEDIYDETAAKYAMTMLNAVGYALGILSDGKVEVTSASVRSGEDYAPSTSEPKQGIKFPYLPHQYHRNAQRPSQRAYHPDQSQSWGYQRQSTSCYHVVAQNDQHRKRNKPLPHDYL